MNPAPHSGPGPVRLPPWPWRMRREPAAPAAAVAWGDVAARLHAHLNARLDAHQHEGPGAPAAACTATAGSNVLVVLGEAAALPWVDGVAYAAPCAHAPGLWLPTLWEPDLPADLLARALQRLHGRQPLLLWREPPAVVPLDRQLPLTPALLARMK